MTDLTPAPPHLDDESLVAILDGEVADAERGTTEAHLDHCETCRGRRDALAAASAFVATPVEPLSSEMRDAVLARALAVADGANGTGTDEVVAAPVVPIASRRKAKRSVMASTAAAAAAVIVAAVAATLATTVHSTARSPSAAGNGGAAGATTPLPISPPARKPLLELRPVLAGNPPSCPSVAWPDPGKALALPDAIESPARHRTCLLLGPAVSTLTTRAPASISGPPGLAGPDALTVTLSGQVARKLSVVHGPAGQVTLPDGHELVAVADGAVIGTVADVSAGAGGSSVVEIREVSPAVAEYLDNLLNG